MNVSIYIPINSARVFPFLHTLSSIYCFRLFDDGHSEQCEVVSHCSFDLHLSNNEWGEGNGTPLQYSCLENPMDGGAWGLQSMGSLRVEHD